MNLFLKRNKKLIALFLVTMLIGYGVFIYFADHTGSLCIHKILLLKSDMNSPTQILKKGEPLTFVIAVSRFKQTKMGVFVLSEDIILRGPDKTVFYAKKQYKKFTRITTENTIFLETTIELPANLVPSGSYELLVRLHDQLRESETASIHKKFTISDEFMLTLSSLSLCNLERIPLDAALVLPGSTFFIRGQISGFKLSQNSFCNLRGNIMLSSSLNVPGKPFPFLTITQSISSDIRAITFEEPFSIPPDTSVGDYFLEISITDDNQERSVHGKIPVKVQ